MQKQTPDLGLLYLVSLLCLLLFFPLLYSFSYASFLSSLSLLYPLSLSCFCLSVSCLCLSLPSSCLALSFLDGHLFDSYQSQPTTPSCWGREAGPCSVSLDVPVPTATASTLVINDSAPCLGYYLSYTPAEALSKIL